MANIIVREYNPTTGAFINNISSLSFGRIVAGSHSPVKVLDFTFTGVEVVTDIKLGVVTTGGIDVTQFGYNSSAAFDLSLATGPCPNHFTTLNSGTSSSSPANSTVSIANRDDTTSNFVYLDISLGSGDLGSGAGSYKIYFVIV